MLHKFRLLPRAFFVSIIIAGFACPRAEEISLEVGLEYDYQPGGEHWARYGAIQHRTFSLRTQGLMQIQLGTVNIKEEDESYVLTAENDAIDYFLNATTSILTYYGVVFSAHSRYRLNIIPLVLDVAAFDDYEGGRKRCRAAFQVRLIGPDTTELFSALVENVGIDVCDDDDENEYKDLINKTIHGALVKLWASQALYTEKPLGRGKIEKMKAGVYGFVPDSIKEAKMMVVIDSLTGDTATISMPADTAGMPGIQETAAQPGDIAAHYAGGPISANYDDSQEKAAIIDGKKVPVAVLPFENATQNERFGQVVIEAHDHFISALTRSSTIKVMERDKLSDILKEQALGLSGIMDDSTVVEIGNISGVKAMIAVRFYTIGGYFRLHARVINVESSAIVATATVDIPDAISISEAAPILASKLLMAFTQEHMAVNLNAVNYPSVCPGSIGALTASVEDAWAVEKNPAALMKLKRRDVSFFVSLAERISGEYAGQKISTLQPAFSNIGVNFGIPINPHVASGFSIRHEYTFPRIKHDSLAMDLKEEKTVFVAPVGIGINPMISLGMNLRAHLTEYQMTQMAAEYLSGSSQNVDATIGALFKFAQKFKAGIAYTSKSFYAKGREKQGTVDSLYPAVKEMPHDFKVGIAMYPWRWLFFFADLHYEKYQSVARYQPGFYLGAQLTHHGKILGIRQTPEYGMLPLYLGYWHEPYNRLLNVQSRYFSIGTGYYLNNIYFRWSMRFNAEPENERFAVLGVPGNNVRIEDYSFRAPFFITIGYQF